MSNKSSLTESILKIRGIDKAEWPRYLDPDFERDTYDPFLMPGMREAVKRLRKAIESKEKIVLFGDYDADGVPAVALFIRSLSRFKGTMIPIIPRRHDGYGLTGPSVERIVQEKPDLLITIDNGTTAAEEIGRIQALGTDVIVCDHHEPQEQNLPTWITALLNPKMPDSKYPFSELCACAIVWKFMQALYMDMQIDLKPLKWELDLVGLSTVADMVPLVGENHTLAAYGLKVLRQSRNAGIKALAQVAEVNLEKLTTREVGFRLAPHINAPSRMHQEEIEGENAALALLTTTDPLQAEILASHLHQQNIERQTVLNQHIKEAEGMVETRIDDLCMVLYQPGWSTGLIGLVAGRILDKTNRPVVVLATEGGVLKGSVRSVEGVHVLDLLSTIESHLDHYGGHAKAGGLTLSSGEDTIETISASLNEWMKEKGWTLERLAEASQREADQEIDLQYLTLEAVSDLQRLEPFGMGFPAPVFQTTCLLRDVSRMGSESQHLRCFLDDGSASRKAVGFGWGHYPVRLDSRYEVRYSVQVETWRDVSSPVCFIESLRPVK